ncbi:MAG: TM2 domain-containing protein [Chitinophagales bacterium]|nr:TM2 domain-containing protein [Chitinophagales bacterium]
MRFKAVAFSVAFCLIAITASAAEFKLDSAAVNSLFNSSVDISSQYMNSDSTKVGTIQDSFRVSKNTAALLAIFGSSLGLHRYYMGHDKAGCMHLTLNFLSIGACAAVTLIGVYSNPEILDPPLNLPTLIVIGGLSYIALDKIMGFIEGVTYLASSDSRFRNKILKNQRYLNF